MANATWRRLGVLGLVLLAALLVLFLDVDHPEFRRDESGPGALPDVEVHSAPVSADVGATPSDVAPRVPAEVNRGCAIIVEVTGWDGKPAAGHIVHLFVVKPPGFSTFPAGKSAFIKKATGADGVVEFEALDVGVHVQLAIEPAAGLAVDFDAWQSPVAHKADGEVVIQPRPKVGKAGQYVSGLIPVSADHVWKTRIRIGAGASIEGRIDLADCTHCSINVNRLRNRVNSTVDFVTQSRAGEFRCEGLPPGRGYSLSVLCENASAIYLAAARFDLDSSGPFVVPPISWIDIGYELECIGWDRLPETAGIDVRVRDPVSRDAYMLKLGPARSFRIVGLGVLEVTYVGISNCWEMEAKVVSARALHGTPAVIEVRRRSEW
jgi:hypothetical protein